MGSHPDDLVHEVHVVRQVVFLVGVEHVSAVADGRLNNATCLLDGLDSNFKLVDVVEGVKDAEDVDTILLGLLAKMVDGVVRESETREPFNVIVNMLRSRMGLR